MSVGAAQKAAQDARQRWRERPGLVLGAPLGAARPDGREAERARALASRVREIPACSEAHSRTCSMLSAASVRCAAAMSEHDATLMCDVCVMGPRHDQTLSSIGRVSVHQIFVCVQS